MRIKEIKSTEMDIKKSLPRVFCAFLYLDNVFITFISLTATAYPIKKS